MFLCILNNRKSLQLILYHLFNRPPSWQVNLLWNVFIQLSNFMVQLYTNIQTDFPDQIFLELFQFKTRSRFWETQYIYISHQELVSCNQNIFIIPQNWYWDRWQQVKNPRSWLGIEVQVSWFDLRCDDHNTTSAWMFHRLQLLGFSLNFGHQWLQGRCSASWPVTNWLCMYICSKNRIKRKNTNCGNKNLGLLR